MADFKVVFRGAVCHVGDDESTKTHAILLQVDQSPKISVRAEDRLDSQQPLEINIPAGANIEFQGIAAGTATAGPLFKRLVPSIKPLLHDPDASKKELQPNVKARAEHERVAAYLKYPTGALRGRKPFMNKVKFRLVEGTTIEQCVAGEVEFISAGVNNPVTLIVRPRTGEPSSFQLKPSATVQIENKDVNKGFPLVRELTHASRIAKASIGTPCTATSAGIGENPAEAGPRAIPVPPGLLPKTEAKANDAGDVEMLGFPNPECTNSGWP